MCMGAKQAGTGSASEASLASPSVRATKVGHRCITVDEQHKDLGGPGAGASRFDAAILQKSGGTAI